MRALFGQKPWVLSVDPYLPQMAHVLKRIVELLLSEGKAVRAIDELEDLERIRNYQPRILLYNIFGATEDVHENIFNFSNADATLGDYSMAFKQISCNFMGHRQIDILSIISIMAAQNNVCWRGVSKEILLLADAYRGIGDVKTKPKTSKPRIFFNLIISIIIFGLTLGWILTRIRLASADSKQFFFAADYIDDYQDVELYRELQDGGAMLMVNRIDLGRNRTSLERDGYKFCSDRDGYFNFPAALHEIKRVIPWAWRLYRHSCSMHPRLLYQAMLLPWRRAILSAFFNRYRPKWYWGRDPYNVEHILRRQEIKRIGGKSLGVNTGYLTYTIVLPMWRYISYDYFYVFGSGPYLKHYSNTFSPDMVLRSVGTFSAPRSVFEKRNDPRSKDIVIFSGVFAGEPEMLAMVRGLAEAFPDRRINLQVKPGIAESKSGKIFIDACCKDLSNVTYTTRSVYELMISNRFGITDPSSIAAESIQLGMETLVLDIPALQVTSIWRDYDGLVVENAAEAVEKFRSFESNTCNYPSDRWTGLFDNTGISFFDHVRNDLGLDLVAPRG